MFRRWLLASLLLTSAAIAWADEPATKKPAEAKSVIVPYHLTDTHHVMVRVKINGKGPFNLIVDTGCPVLIVSKEAGKKIGLSTDKKGWAVLDTFEIEGGLKDAKVKCRVETPFQIEGMNSMGLPGVELHGMLGYTVLAKYRMQFDFKSDKMRWTPLDFKPPAPAPLGGKANLASLEAMAGLMKVVSFLTGIKPPPPPVQRGFFGIELVDKGGHAVIERVLPGSPAAKAGLKPGDRIDTANDANVATTAALLGQTAKLTPGQELTLTVTRGKDNVTVKLIAGNGL